MDSLALRRYSERYPLGHKHLAQIDSIMEGNIGDKDVCDTDDILEAVSHQRLSSRTTPSLTTLTTPPTTFVGAGSHGDTQSDFNDFITSAYAYDQGGFEISSLSFDFDAIPGLYSTETVFNGSEFILK